ncbi:MAG: MarR family transcriptional regulator [Gemmatimonadota bacterium]|nr:MarR family transcriptional regulator [Gemmatimonadota bacterium]
MAGDTDFVDHALAQLDDEMPGLDTIHLRAGERLLRLAGSLKRRVDAALAPTGVRSAGFGVLAALRRAGEPYELTPSELSRQTLLTSGAMTNRIDRLEAAGLARRGDRSAEDRRSVLVRLTPAGKKLVDAAYPLYCAELGRVTAELTDREARALERGLKKASLSLGDVAPDAESSA